MSNRLKALVLGFAGATCLAGAAQAGGFDRGGVNIDLIFSGERVAADASVTHVMPQRTIKNVQRQTNEAVDAGASQQVAPLVVAGGFAPPGTTNPSSAQVQAWINSNPAVNGGRGTPAFTQSINVEGDYTVPRFSFKVGLTDDLACLATYSEPFGADANYGLNNAYSPSATEFSIDTRDYGLTCSYQFAGPELGIGQSYFRVIGGVSYQELDGFQARQRFLDFAQAGQATVGGVTNPAGIGTFNVSGDSVGYRVGAAFEVPEIALRAQLVYNSAYHYDLKGFQDNTGFGAVIPGTQMVPISTSTEIPQSVEFKLQSGIAPGTLASFGVKWQQWSKLDVIPISGGLSPATGQPTNLSFDPRYRDGWTISGGVGRQFTDMVAGSLGMAWDRGTATVTGTQTDTWTFSAGVALTPNDNFEIRLGGALGVLTGGTSQIPPAGGDAANNVTYSFGDDLISALSASVRATF